MEHLRQVGGVMTKLLDTGKPRRGKYEPVASGLLEKGTGRQTCDNGRNAVLELTAWIGTATLTQN
ncbi:hypothetical protein WH91_09245 [Devosia psychrophila]|uniref:Uncharacterized protein n=1 Tax=Devosia psychrophila TaxID=728005 RepID=A0ABR5DYX1_9HYPH|nr:hypothetical protein WH91_09245 [Devosia psychrophila]